MRCKQSRQWGYFVGCPCHAVGPNAETPDEAVIRWDKRVFQTSLDQMIDAGAM